MLKFPDGALLQELRVREYTSRDKYPCEKVLTSNYGDFFSRDILRYFADYLAQEKCYYLVIERGKQVIACGGIEFYGGQNRNTLVFGLVHRTPLNHIAGGRIQLFQGCNTGTNPLRDGSFFK